MDVITEGGLRPDRLEERCGKGADHEKDGWDRLGMTMRLRLMSFHIIVCANMRIALAYMRRSLLGGCMRMINGVSDGYIQNEYILVSMVGEGKTVH